MKPESQQHDTPTPEELGHEPIEVSSSAIVSGFAALFASLIAALILMAALVFYFTKADGGSPTVQAPVEPFMVPPGVPELNPNQRGALRMLRLEEKAILTEYEWLDSTNTLARIPIRRAMEIIAEQSNSAESSNDATSNR